MNSPAWKLVVLTGMMAALALPAGAHPKVLHDQRDQLGFFSAPSDDYDGQDPLDNQLADDFTVPPGQSWHVTQADLIGSAAASVPSVVNAWIYGSAGTLPGAQLFNQSGITASNQGNYAVPLAGTPALGPGTYWLSIQQTGAFYATQTWAWQTRIPQDGNPAVFRNPNGGYVSGNCLDWTPQKTCFPSNDVDLGWSISGDASSLHVTFGKLKRAGNGTARLAVKLPAPGTLALSGKGVKGVSAQVAARKATASVTLKIRATGKAKKALSAKGRVTVKAKFTYTASGAEPTTTIKKVKLEKG
jgi:hypothetical protein